MAEPCPKEHCRERVPHLATSKLFLRAVTVWLIGIATEGGLFRGTGITCVLVSIEVIDSSIRLRHSQRSRIWSILYVAMQLNVIYSILMSRLVHEKVDVAA
ncbi:uncharacterized protein LOC119344477 [Triticum dicoccoides]|uniref:uncharacterized protein LOC119344477 n=1 Tax=Triticum dicoccoides TaxID=85692 RepID=UPI00188F8B60|nr:uncharacterized protein LOC119344477 [Triticum dicoccoides]XP_037470790.1 uncharacterized protein LOC119344477 [Triticum dicoccoides]XP_037470791.1 uncharacterized protein LOC119344477 [Triticum dicoccoides]XP_037470792.1 uncharacterized protein LOC119344477 [Triticum dicoccoides]XP_037470793.1 uncharacterized protein LOC119344477 [Triticum dicoccoides]XP_037470794.1 uncharacterized protein LOC119344477 [Triticum dicoccoides]